MKGSFSSNFKALSIFAYHWDITIISIVSEHVFEFTGILPDQKRNTDEENKQYSIIKGCTDLDSNQRPLCYEYKSLTTAPSELAVKVDSPISIILQTMH